MNDLQPISELGQGSFGRVYLVKDSKERHFALKKIRVTPFDVEQAQLEIDIMKKFIHPNLVKIYHYKFSDAEQQLSILMEYCEEGDLLNYFKKKNRQLSSQEILRIFKQISQAFIVMNVKGVFHRDLKPENILIGKAMVIKVADFGCARSVVSTEISKIDNFSVQRGTPIYAAPELLKSESYSSKCDVWSAGCMLYFLYFNRHPFTEIKMTYNTSILELINEKFKQDKLKKQLHHLVTDSTIRKILQLCLQYEDKERASWREIWLHRVFAQKVEDVSGFVEYIRYITIIANWIAKEFWKIRKQFAIKNAKEQLFVFFLIKFQYSALKMAMHIMKKNQSYKYLFNQQSFYAYNPSKQQYQQLKKMYHEHESYSQSVKKSLQNKQAYQSIIDKETHRCSAFADLDNTIRTAYKILLQVKGQLENSPPKKENKVWLSIARLINFEKWFAFEKEPRVEKIICENVLNLRKQVEDEIQKYEMGVVE